MNNKLLSCLIAGALTTTLALASPTFGRGGGMGGGMHGGGNRPAPPTRSVPRSRYEWRPAIPPRSWRQSRAGSARLSASPDRSERRRRETRRGSESRFRRQAPMRCGPTRLTCEPRRSPADATRLSQSISAFRERLLIQFPTFGQGYFKRVTQSMGRASFFGPFRVFSCNIAEQCHHLTSANRPQSPAEGGSGGAIRC